MSLAAAALCLLLPRALRAGLVLEDSGKPMPGGVKSGWDNVQVQPDRLWGLIPEASEDLEKFLPSGSLLIPVDLSNFKGEVKDSPLPVLLLYCDPMSLICGEIRPFMEDLADRYKGKIYFAVVDLSKDEGALRRENVVPHFYLYKDGAFKKMKLTFFPDKSGQSLDWDIAPAGP